MCNSVAQRHSKLSASTSLPTVVCAALQGTCVRAPQHNQFNHSSPGGQLSFFDSAVLEPSVFVVSVSSWSPSSQSPRSSLKSSCNSSANSASSGKAMTFRCHTKKTKDKKPTNHTTYSVQSEAVPSNPWPMDHMLNCGAMRVATCFGPSSATAPAMASMVGCSAPEAQERDRGARRVWQDRGGLLQ